MGLTINMGNKNSPPEEGLVKKLLKPQDLITYNTVRDVLKAQFKLGFYDVEMIVGSNTYMATMPVTVSNILKGGASDAQRSLCRGKLMNMFSSALMDAGVGVPDSPKADFDPPSHTTKIPGMPKIGEIEAAVGKTKKDKTMAELVKDMEAVAKGIDPTKPGAAEKLAAKLTGNQLPPQGYPVALKDAQAIGQPVRGSSTGSIYYTVAMSERVKLAVRIKNETISVRAEGNFSNLDTAKFQAFGMSQGAGGKYYSMHVSCEGVPVPRVMGAILMGLGIDFDQQVTNFKQIKVS